jgi:CDP-diacylglycerol--serine O-phosphatidyltransferase
VLPTVFTVGNLFCGFSSVIQSIQGELVTSAVMIFVAGVLDGLDGRIARLTGSASAFGLQFDTVADIVSFGLAPAVLGYQWILAPLGRIGWLAAFLYVVCTAMRLARFNIQTHASDKRYFVGLPSPLAGGTVASVVFAFPSLPRTEWLAGVAVAGMVAIAGLMLSRLRYRSFKELDLRLRRTFLLVLPIAALLVAIASHPEGMLLALCALYVFSAPVVAVWQRLRRIRRPEVPDPHEGTLPEAAEVSER